jgi:hypothetical protein
VPNALEFLAGKFDPLIEASGNLWDALLRRKGAVIKAWDEINDKAKEVFEDNISTWLKNLNDIWDNLVIIVKGDIDDTTESIDKWGDTWIETIGDIITLGLDVLAIAIEGIIDLVLILTEALVGLTTGDWSGLAEAFTGGGERARALLEGLGDDIADLLNLNVEGVYREGERIGQPHDIGTPTQIEAPPTVSGGGRIHGEAQNTQNFNLTVNTSAPAESTIADFRMMAAMARGAIP